MVIIDGKAVALHIREKVKAEVAELKTEGAEVALAVILAGNDPASRVYVQNKVNACKETGISSRLYTLDENVDKNELLELISSLNNDKNVNGIMVQLPLPKALNEEEILDRIDPDKDVDGCHYIQKGKLWTGRDALVPCTPYGVMELLRYYGIKTAGKNAVVAGRSNLVGKPLAELLLKGDATVTVCHSKTPDLGAVTKNADILLAAVGKAGIIKADMVKDGAVVVDIGINRVDGKLFGDVDFENVKDKCSFITPVPGGVGPMTVAMLMQNTVKAYRMQNKPII